MCGCGCHDGSQPCPVIGGCCSASPLRQRRPSKSTDRDLGCDQCSALVDPNIALLSERRFGRWLCSHCYHTTIARDAGTPVEDWPKRPEQELLIWEDEAAERIVAQCSKCATQIMSITDHRSQYGCRKAITARWSEHVDRNHPPIGEIIQENGETGLVTVGQHAYSTTIKDPHDLTYEPCLICGLPKTDDVHEKDNQYMRDRIGADLVQCLDCGAMVDALETTRVMKDHSGRMVQGRMCKVCLTPPAKRNPYVVLAVKLQRGLITEDEYEAELEKLTT